MAEDLDAEIDKLRARIERTLDRGDAESMPLAIELLENLAHKAPIGSDDAQFAHRKLAELLLEQHPWRAALHVRSALARSSSDDALHAMMGLCQALLGNYRAAVSAYDRASRLAPAVGWYHHNLGHLLDVALEDPERAEAHLRTACRLASHHDEVVGSLAHCLARVGKLDEARDVAKRACALKPNKPAHRDLLDWIERGAPRDDRPSTSRRGRDGRRESSRQREVADAVTLQMQRVGYAPPVVEGARRLWADFSKGRPLRIVKTAVYAAAVEYAMASLTAWPGASQAAVARRYGVAPASVGTRYAEIRQALDLRPFDNRYVSKT